MMQFATEDDTKIFETRRITNGRKKAVKNTFMIGWDGEGVTVNEDTREHWYILFGNSVGNKVINRKGSLSTRECLKLILATKLDYPDAINVSFAFSYDVEMMLRDLNIKSWQRLYTEQTVRWAEYTIQYYPGKWFNVSSMVDGKKVSARIWDLFGFFQTSFVSALQANLPDTPNLEKIISGKGSRSTFDLADFDTLILPYWVVEIEALAKLAEQLRSYLHTAELYISSWHGPGAIANYLFRTKGIKEHKGNTPTEVANMSQFAFSGGRFEQFRVGRANAPVYVYDINSAHPSGIAKLPSLTSGSWRHVERRSPNVDFGIYFARYYDREGMAPVRPQPMFYRDRNGLVTWPAEVYNCYWTPEIQALELTGHADKLDIIEGWEYHHDGTLPFKWVPEMYDTRQKWKAAGNGAQMALKLGLNSLFGKTAQRIGWERNNRAPTWHQLEWAGFITSHTRSVLWPALWQAWEKQALIAVETDSVFSLEPLDLPLSKSLGEWGLTKYDDCIFLQNGVYFLLKDGNWIPKHRGLDRGSFEISDVINYIDNLDVSVDPNPNELDRQTYKELIDARHIVGTTTRFVGGRAALHRNRPDMWRTWRTEPRSISVGIEGKRVHYTDMCYECFRGNHKLGSAMHYQRVSNPYVAMSTPHTIPWRQDLAETANFIDGIGQGEVFSQ